MHDPKRSSVVVQDLAVGLGVLALAAVVAWQTTVIPENAIYAKVGPKVFPWLSAGLLAAMGSLLTLAGLRGGWEHERSGETNWPSLAWLVGGLLLNVALISHLGFIIAGTILFICTARAFASQQPVRDALIGFALGVIAYVGFDRVLGYKIGSGLIERLL
ncbi:MAG: tripartite tricarboxylate transporter TctB family protein [Hyphomicrobiaceae bacterium]